MKKNHLDQQLNLKPYFPRVLFWKFHAIFFAIALVFFGVYYFLSYRQFDQRLNIAREKSFEVSTKAQKLEKQQQARILNKKGQKPVSALNHKAAGMRENMLPVLDTFSSSIHSGLWLQYFSFQRHPNGRDSISIQGSALEKIMVREYILSLKRSKLFPSRLFSSLSYSTGFSPPEKAAMEHLQGDMKTKKSFFTNFSMSYKGAQSSASTNGGGKQNSASLIQQLLKRGK